MFNCGLAQLVVLAAVAADGNSLLGVPGEADRLLARIAPDDCLFYASWAGLVSASPESTNELERLLAEPELQALAREVEQRVIRGIEQQMVREDPATQFAIRQMLEWSRVLCSRPATVFVSRANLARDGPDVSAGAVVNLGERANEFAELLKKLETEMLAGVLTPVNIGDARLYQIQAGERAPPVTLGVRGRYLLFGVGEGVVEGILDRVRTEPPEWLRQLTSELSVERPAAVAYLNIRAILRQAETAAGPGFALARDAFGLGNVDSLAMVSGLDANAAVSRTLLRMDGVPEGLLAPLAAAPLTADDLAPVPRDALFACTFRLDADKYLETVLSSVEQVEPGARRSLERELAGSRERLGIRLREDVLQSFGDVWTVYLSRGEGGWLAGWTAVAKLKNRDRLQSALNMFAGLVNAQAQRFGGGGGPRITAATFRNHQIQVFDARDNGFLVAPSWCLTDTEFIVSLFPQGVKAYLARDDDAPSLATAPEVASLFQPPRGPLAVSYVDTKGVFELAYPFLQIAAQFAAAELAREGVDLDIALLPSGTAIGRHLRPGVASIAYGKSGVELTSRQSLPGVGAAAAGVVLAAIAGEANIDVDDIARGVARVVSPAAAAQQDGILHLKMIALAMHNYHDTHQRFPPAFSTDEDGNPLLSWRVHLLPYLEARELYKRFHLDEPWDSEHNRQLIPLMPDVLKGTGGKAAPGKTNYLTVREKNSIFPGKDPVGFAQITDGTSNTILVVEASDERAVIWTKPDDFVPQEDNPIKGLVGLRDGGFLAALADGSVRLVPADIGADTLLLLFQRNDGRPFNFDFR